MVESKKESSKERIPWAGSSISHICFTISTGLLTLVLRIKHMCMEHTCLGTTDSPLSSCVEKQDSWKSNEFKFTFRNSCDKNWGISYLQFSLLHRNSVDVDRGDFIIMLAFVFLRMSNYSIYYSVCTSTIHIPTAKPRITGCKLQTNLYLVGHKVS